MSNVPNGSTNRAKKKTRGLAVNGSVHYVWGGQPASDAEILFSDERRDAPWTAEQYERVRQAAIAVVRSHEIGGKVNGRLVWDLMNALDRTVER